MISAKVSVWIMRYNGGGGARVFALTFFHAPAHPRSRFNLWSVFAFIHANSVADLRGKDEKLMQENYKLKNQWAKEVKLRKIEYDEEERRLGQAIRDQISHLEAQMYDAGRAENEAIMSYNQAAARLNDLEVRVRAGACSAGCGCASDTVP